VCADRQSHITSQTHPRTSIPLLSLSNSVNKMMEGLASHDEEMERLEATFMKRLKALAKIDSEKSLQNFLSLL